MNKIKELFGKEPLNVKNDAPFILYYKDGSIKFINMDKDCKISCEYQDVLKECCFEIACDRVEDNCSYMYLSKRDIRGFIEYLQMCLQMMEQ